MKSANALPPAALMFTLENFAGFTGRMVIRSNDGEVVVHDELAFGTVALLHPLDLARGRVHEHHICFASRTEGQGGTGTNRDRLDVISTLLLEDRDQHVK